MLDFDTIVFVDTEKYNTKENIKAHYDIAFEINIKDTEQKLELYFILEHKSSPYKNIFIQLLSYIYARFNDVARENKKLPLIVPIVVYVGEKEWNISTSIIKDLPIDNKIKEYIFDLKYILNTPKDMIENEKVILRKSLELYSYIMLLKLILGKRTS